MNLGDWFLIIQSSFSPLQSKIALGFIGMNKGDDNGTVMLIVIRNLKFTLIFFMKLQLLFQYLLFVIGNYFSLIPKVNYKL